MGAHTILSTLNPRSMRGTFNSPDPHVIAVTFATRVIDASDRSPGYVELTVTTKSPSDRRRGTIVTDTSRQIVGLASEDDSVLRNSIERRLFEVWTAQGFRPFLRGLILAPASVRAPGGR